MAKRYEASHAPGAPATTAGAPEAASTRERILDVALRLFTEQGFDATSLQQVADELGITKAALYYHFRSKEDILMALHLRMHEFGRRALDELATGTVTLEAWSSLLDSLLDELFAQRPLFLMHERNQAAFERVHREDHLAEHQDFLGRLRQVLADPAIPLRDRVKMSCSLGATFTVMFVAMDTLGSDPEEVKALLREAVHDLLFS